MKVLLVHDRPTVLEEIVHLLEMLDLDGLNIDRAEDGVNAREFLRTNAYDVAIIDLTIAHISGKGRPDYAVAENLLQETMSDVGLNAPGDIIGLTREADALNRIDTMVGSNLMALVHEDVAGAWRREISDRVSYCWRHVAARQRSMFSRHEIDVAVITALDEEFEPYHDLFELDDHPRAVGVKTFLFKDASGATRTGVGMSVGRAGQAAAASATQALVTQFRPRLLLMSGICGGIRGKVELGDVLFAENVFDWDYGKWKAENSEVSFHPRPEPIGIRDSSAHRMARAIVADRDPWRADVRKKMSELSSTRLASPSLKLVPYGSGSAVVGNEAILARIEQLNDRIAGIDMESFGFYYAASHTPVVRGEMICVKSVSDFCDIAKSDGYHKVCCYLSAVVVEDIIKRRWAF